MRKSKIFLGLILFLFVLPIQAQKIIILRGDTMVAITPSQLSAMNVALYENEMLKKEVQLKDSLIKLDSISISGLERTVETITIREKKKEEYYIDQAEKLTVENKKLKASKKRGILTNIISGGSGVIVGLLIGILLL